MSGRVVKTSIDVVRPSTGKSTCAPVERPIQLRCISLTDSGQSSASRSSSSRSAYAVIRIIHCFRLRLKTGKLPRSLRPSAVTSSLASTVPRPGHQLTGASRDVGQPVVVDDRAPLDAGQLGPRPAVRRRPRRRRRTRRPARRSAGPCAASGVVPGVEDLQEDPLGPAVEVRVGGGDAAAVVVAPGPAGAAAPRYRSMFASVVIRGCVPVCTAYCSAGRPNASKPIGCSTL